MGGRGERKETKETERKADKTISSGSSAWLPPLLYNSYKIDINYKLPK